jgi:hypothetical protein
VVSTGAGIAPHSVCFSTLEVVWKELEGGWGAGAGCRAELGTDFSSCGGRPEGQQAFYLLALPPLVVMVGEGGQCLSRKEQ